MPSSSKNFFSFATRCWPYTNVETECEAVTVFWARAQRGTPAMAPAAVVAVRARKRRRFHVIEHTSK